MSERLDAKQWEICAVDIAKARFFIEQFHYAKGASNTAVYVHGLFRRGCNKMMGVAWWMPPTKVAAQSVHDDWQSVLALSRLCVHPDVPQNGASFLMAGSIKIIKAEQRWFHLVTYADDFRSHTGTIYRATNWQYVGHMKGSPRWEDENGKQIARKSTVSRTDQEMRDLGYRNVGTFGKHKFVMHLRKRRKPEKRGTDDLFGWVEHVGSKSLS